MKSLHKMFWLLIFLPIFNNTIGQSNEDVKMAPFATGLSNSITITHAGDSRLFVVDQAGYIRIVDSGGKVNPEPFLDIHERVIFEGERGLLGLAFHPNYQSNGYFFVNYVGQGNRTRISRFEVSAANADLANPESELNLITQLQPFNNHKGGDLKFGPDGFLYIGLGDGGGAGDPDNRARNPMERLGKMLRIDVNQGNPYAIPASNPFYESTSTLGEIWALGLRNPWRFSFDRLTGDLWIADVGQDKEEEINFQPAASKGGEHYGWRCYEGNLAFNNAGCDAQSAYTFPIYTYPHGGLECSITGGFVYRGTESSPYYGHYFFADWCSDRIWTLHKEGENWIREDFGQYPGNNFATFGEDAQGQLYISGTTSATVFKVLDNTTGTKRGNVLTGIKVIQVPNSNKIRIETGVNDGDKMQIALSDIKGIVLYTATTREASYEFDPGNLPMGTYLVNIGMDGKKFVQKLIKGIQ